MKIMFMAVTALYALSCVDENTKDNVLWDKMETLKEWQAVANDNIIALQEVIEALQDDDLVTSVTTFTTPFPGGSEVRFQKKSKSVRIFNGLSGMQERDIVQIAAGPYIDETSYYYWIVGDKWLGSKEQYPVASQGTKKGVTPQLRVNGNTKTWEISYDETNWTSVQTLDYGPQEIPLQTRKGTETGDWLVSTNGGRIWEPSGLEAMANEAEAEIDENGFCRIRNYGATEWTTTKIKVKGEKGTPSDAVFVRDGVDNSSSPYCTLFLLINGDIIKIPKTENAGDGNAAFDLTNYLNSPIANSDRPQKEITNHSNFRATIVWQVRNKTNPSTWENMTSLIFTDTDYRAQITLYAHSEYTFPKDFSVRHAYASPEVSEKFTLINDSTAMGYLYFKTVMQEIETSRSIDLSPYLSRPVAGNTPPLAFPTEICTGTIVWKVGNTPMKEDENFQMGTIYTAEITLRPIVGHKFPEGSMEVKHNEVATIQPFTPDPNDHRYRKGSLTFPATTRDIPVNDPNLTYRIPAPMMGEWPIPAFTSSQYKGTVMWSPEPDGSFEIGRMYTATVTLMPEPGYIFTATDHNPGRSGAFIHNGGTIQPYMVTYGKSLTINIAFPSSSASSPSIFSGRSGVNDSAIDLIRAAVKQGTLQFKITATQETETAEFLGNTDLGTKGLILAHDGNSELFDRETNNSPAYLTIDGGGLTVDLTGTNVERAPLITVGSGVTLTLNNITFRGLASTSNAETGGYVKGNDADNNAAPLIVVKNGGSLILESGARIMDNDAEGNTGGIIVEDNGSLTMNNGAEISNVAGGTGVADNNFIPGAVMVQRGGKFTMNGGFIRNNKTRNDGGGVSVTGGQFIMNDGTVSGNKAESSHSSGGGVVLHGQSSQFIMRGGIISGNTARRYGGGVVMTGGLFNMENGDISGNTVHNDNGVDGMGGGVYNQGGSFNMTNGNISGNTARNHGGGVYIQGGFDMRYGNITGNTVENPDGNGGGVYVGKGTEGGVFTMSGGNISGNSIFPQETGEASQTGGKGIGVYVENSSCRFIKTRGTVHGLVTSDNTQWEEKSLQNCYMWQMDNMEGEKHYAPYSNGNGYSETGGGRHRGYAIYFDHENRPRWCDRTVVNTTSLNTDTSDNWE